LLRALGALGTVLFAQKLSLSAPMVLGRRRPGRVGRSETTEKVPIIKIIE